MYKCYDCGVIFETLAEWRESRGEFWGSPAYERVVGCPCCHSTEVDDYDPEKEDEDESEEEEDEDDE